MVRGARRAPGRAPRAPRRATSRWASDLGSLQLVREEVAGLPVLVASTPHAHSAVVMAHIAVGPRWETPRTSGISHFLEHMLYRGTAQHPTAHALALAFERLGSSLAATTTADHGTLAVAVPPQNLDAVLPLLGECLARPALDGIEVERGIVREEILELLSAQGRLVDADDLLRLRAFPGHGLGLPITGGLAELARFDVASLRRHHRRHYTRGGLVLTVAGPVDARRVLEAVPPALAGLPAGRVPASPPPPPPGAWEHFHEPHQDSQVELRLGFRAPGERDPWEPATELALRVLDDGMSTRLYHAVCDLRGLCYDVSASYEAYSDAGLVEVAASAAPERTSAVAEVVVGVLRELRDHGPTEEELDRVKSRLVWQLDELLDDPGELCAWLGLEELGGAPRAPLARLERLLEVSRVEVREAAERLFRMAGMSSVTVGALGARQTGAVTRALQGLG